MAEKEYIEREVALEAAKKSHLYFDIKPIINSIPAADVRPVITCGECIYFRLNSCMRWAEGTFMERTDFCSRAAKREES